MKLTAFATTPAALVAYATSAAASTGAREDSSGLFVWIFLGFCALIVVAQLVPAIMVVLGFAKAFGKQKEEVPQTVPKQ